MFKLMIASTLILASPARAESTEGDAARDSLRYLRDHVDLFVEAAPPFEPGRVTRYSLIVGSGATLGAIALYHATMQLFARDRLSLDQALSLTQGFVPKIALTGIAIMLGGVLIDHAMNHRGANDRADRSLEWRRQHRALVDFLNLPVEDALGRLDVDPVARELVILLAENLKAQELRGDRVFPSK